VTVSRNVNSSDNDVIRLVEYNQSLQCNGGGGIVTPDAYYIYIADTDCGVVGKNWFREGRRSGQPGFGNDAHRRLGFKPVYCRPAAHITNSQSKDRFLTIR